MLQLTNFSAKQPVMGKSHT